MTKLIGIDRELLYKQTDDLPKWARIAVSVFGLVVMVVLWYSLTIGVIGTHK